MRTKQAISLIVLVITIIVMIILAGAIILTLNNAGIIGQSNKAVDKNNLTTLKSLADLKYAEYIINPSVTGGKDLETWFTEELDDDQYYVKMYDNQTHIIKVGTLVDKYYKGEIKIGDYVGYDAGENSITLNQYVGDFGYNNMSEEQVTISSNSNMKWRVLGVEGDKIKLISEEVVNPNGKTGFSLYGAYSYLKGVEILNNACSVFGKGEYAISARSITADDVNEVTGFDKTKYISVIDRRGIQDYAEIPYGTKINYNGEKSTIVNKFGDILEFPILMQPDITATKEEGYVKEQKMTVECTAYAYNAVDEMKKNFNISEPLNDTSYKLLFRSLDNTSGISYMLATVMADTVVDNIYYCIASCSQASLTCNMLRFAGFGTALWDDVEYTSDYDVDCTGSLRPIVMLEGNILVENINNSWEIK